MATKATTTARAKATTKAKADAATPQTAAPAKQAAQTAETLYQISNPFKVRENSARGYAQAQLQALAKEHPNGFTIAQYRAALVSNLAGVEGYQPKGGWEKHNMPTWSAGQDWIKPVAKQA